MKTEVYSWRLSAEKKSDLESEARHEGTSLSALLEEITSDWLTKRRNGRAEQDAEQAAIRKRAAVAIGSIGGDDPKRASRASELAREMIVRKHAKESSAPRRVD